MFFPKFDSWYKYLISGKKIIPATMKIIIIAHIIYLKKTRGEAIVPVNKVECVKLT